MNSGVVNQTTLNHLQLGQTALVERIGHAGAERRRMMDLGILPGTHVTVHMHNPLGDPTAYLIRDTVIALRREQAEQISISIIPS